MNKRQTTIADRLLRILVESEGRTSIDRIKGMLNEEFSERMDGVDIQYVFEILMDDFELITSLGQAWIRLTPEGENMAKRGMKRYRQKLSFNEWINESKLFAFVLFLSSTVFGSLISHLMTTVLTDK